VELGVSDMALANGQIVWRGNMSSKPTYLMCLITRHLELDFKFQTASIESSLKTEHLFRCQHIFGAISNFLHSISAIKLYLETPDGQTCIQASTPIVVC
jgi:hypothetical protein